MFARYAAIVKNLRGAALFDLEESGVWSSVMWLVNRFKYRNLGVTPAIYMKYSDRLEKYMNGNPFRLLTYPIQELSELSAEFSKCINMGLELSELLVMSSLYISPAMVIGKKYEVELDKLSIGAVKTCRELTTSDWKLHMRIADYTVLDMYEFSITTVLRVIENCSSSNISRVLSERLKVIKRDIKRYWRILCSNTAGRVFLYYIDNLKLYIESCGLEKLCGKSDIAAALAIIPVIIIPPGMK